MIWLVINNESLQIVSCNIHNSKEDVYELWVTRVNGKNLKIKEGTYGKVAEIKEAIDYAIENNEKALRL